MIIDSTTIIEGLLRTGAPRERLESDEVHVPHLTDSEVVSALTRLVRSKRIDAEGAKRALDRWIRLGVRRHPARGLMPRMWELRENVKAYDATYVALAEKLDMPLITNDKRLAKAPGARCEIVLLDS